MDFLKGVYHLGSRAYDAITALPADVSLRMLRSVLNQFLSPYLKVKLVDLEAHFSDGVFSFSDLLLEEDVITKKLGAEKLGAMRLTCRFAMVRQLTVVAPYDLENEDLSVTVEGLTLVLSSSQDPELFRSASSSMLESMVAENTLYYEDETGDDSSEGSSNNVYLELQENIADVLSTMKMAALDCRVIVENDGQVFELYLRKAELFDSRRSHVYVVQPSDESIDAVNTKLGIELEQLPPVGEHIKVRHEIEGVTQLLSQRSIRFQSFRVNLFELNLECSSAGEDLLAYIDGMQHKTCVLSYGDETETSEELLFVEYTDYSLSINTSLLASTLCISVSRTVFRSVMESIFALVGHKGDDESEEWGRASLSSSRPNPLSEFSVLYHKADMGLMDSPLRFASAFSDWSLWSSYADTSLLRVSCAIENIQVVLECEHTSTLSVAAVKGNFSSYEADVSKTQWTVEVDGGIELTLDSELERSQEAAAGPLLAIYPSAMALTVVGETVMESHKVASLVAVEHCPPICLDVTYAVFSSLYGIFVLDSTKGNGTPSASSSKSVTSQLEWKQLSVRLREYEVSLSQASLLFEVSPNQRARIEAASFEVRQEVKEIMSMRGAQLQLLWNKPGAPVSSVPLINDLPNLISVPFGGLTAIWGLASEKFKLTRSVVASFPRLAVASDLHLDFACDSFLLNAEQALFHALLRRLPEAAEDIMWITWDVACGDVVASLTHESGARFDHCFSRLVSIGSLGQEHQDLNFLMLDGDRAQLFVSNPSAALPREVLWQKVGHNLADSHLSSIELTNLSTALTCSRLVVSRVADMRIVARHCALSPDYRTWMLNFDFWTDYDASPRETLPVEDGESRWKVTVEQLAVVAQSRLTPTKSHALLTAASLNLDLVSTAQALQLSMALVALRVLVSNSDTLPPAARYADLASFAGDPRAGAAYQLVASMDGLEFALMRDASIEVNVINALDRPLLISVRQDSLSVATVLFANWWQDVSAVLSRPQSPFGSIRERLEESLSQDSLRITPPAKEKEEAVLPSSNSFSAASLGPLLLSPPAANIQVKIFLVEHRDEFKAGSIVRVRWEYRRGKPSQMDWIGLYKTTRGKKSQNYYDYKLTGAAKFGVLEFRVPDKMGFCHFRFFRSAGLEHMMALSESFRVGPLVQLSVTRVKANLYVQRTIVKNDAAYGWKPKSTDWVGLYRVRETNKNRPFQSTFKKMGDGEEGVAFDVPTSPGMFVFRYFADMGWGQSSELARSEPFEVSADDAHKYELVGRTASEEQPRYCVQLSNLHVKMAFSGGFAWEDEARHRLQEEVELEVRLPMATYSLMGMRAKHSVQMHVSVAHIELHDRMARSNYRSVLCFPRAKRVADAPCFQIQMGQLRAEEQQWESRVDVAPLWLNIDQDTLIFMLRFAIACYENIGTDLALDMSGEDSDPMMESFCLVRGEDDFKEEQQEAQEPPAAVLKTLSMSGIEVEIDFRAKGRRLDTLLLSHHKAAQLLTYRVLYWVSGLLSVNESRLYLEPLLLHNLPSNQVTEELTRRWFPQIQQDNVGALLSGFEPIKFVFRLRDATVSLAQRDDKESSSLKEMGRVVVVETFRNLSNLLVGTGNVVKNVNKLAQGGTPPTGRHDVPPTHIKAQSPQSAQEGLKLMGNEVASGFSEGFYGVYAAAAEADSASDGIIRVVRGMPGMVLKPVSAIFRGASIPLRAVAAYADPSISERAALKYKRPELANSDQVEDYYHVGKERKEETEDL